MKGRYLRDLREERGLKAAWVADRAGYAQPHYSKIEAKESISVEEFRRVMAAMDLKAGDHLENSLEDVRPLLPIVEVLKRFTPRAHERVRKMLEEAAGMLEDNLIESQLVAGIRDGNTSQNVLIHDTSKENDAGRTFGAGPGYASTGSTNGGQSEEATDRRGIITDHAAIEDRSARTQVRMRQTASGTSESPKRRGRGAKG